MITADFGIIPIGIEEKTIQKYVAAAVKSIKESGLNYELTGMGTQIEAQNLDELYEAVKNAQEEVFKCGSERVYTVLKIDDRRDKNRSLNDKIKTVNDLI